MAENNRKYSREEAEVIIRDFIHKKHALIENIYLAMIFIDGNFWVIQGEVGIKRLRLFSTIVAVEAKINRDTGEIASYEEAHLKHSEE